MSRSWNRQYSNELWPQCNDRNACLSQNTDFKEMPIKQHHWQQNPIPAHSLICYKNVPCSPLASRDHGHELQL